MKNLLALLCAFAIAAALAGCSSKGDLKLSPCAPDKRYYESE